jgi:hypothetical protein
LLFLSIALALSLFCSRTLFCPGSRSCFVFSISYYKPHHFLVGLRDIAGHGKIVGCWTLHCIALNCAALRYIALFSLHCVFRCVAGCWMLDIALHCIELRCVALYCVALLVAGCWMLDIALHCIDLRCVALRCVVLFAIC